MEQDTPPSSAIKKANEHIDGHTFGLTTFSLKLGLVFLWAPRKQDCRLTTPPPPYRTTTSQLQSPHQRDLEGGGFGTHHRQRRAIPIGAHPQLEQLTTIGAPPPPS